MNVKRVLIGLCGIWAFGLGLRTCTALYSDGGTHILYFSHTNPLLMYWDFGPLFLLGLFTLVACIHDYYSDLRDTRLGDVMLNES